MNSATYNNVLSIVLLVFLFINAYCSFMIARKWKRVSNAWKEVSKSWKEADESWKRAGKSLQNIDKLNNECEKHLNNAVRLVGEIAGIHNMVIHSSCVDKSAILDDIISKLLIAKNENINRINKDKTRLS